MTRVHDPETTGRHEAVERERTYQEVWYARAIADGFFEREGFRRLECWNLARFAKAVPLRPEMRVLSLGCGLGQYELAIARTVHSVVGIDLSETAIAEARKRATEAGRTNIVFQCTALHALEFPPESFDLIYALGVLHHLPGSAQRELFRRARAWLTANGWIYARDPNARSLLRVLGRRFVRGEGSLHSPDERDLDPVAVTEELERSGFRDVRVAYTDVLGGPLPWIVSTSSSSFWTTVFALDRAWLSIPGLRRQASQFSVTARR